MKNLYLPHLKKLDEPNLKSFYQKIEKWIQEARGYSMEHWLFLVR